jgi:Phospholipase_D-nuclease N-terminal
MAAKRWSELTPGTRRFILIAGTVEGLLKAAALTDLARRPAGQVHGRKWAWAIVLVLVNSVGGAPLAYFLFGRRR